MPASKVPGTNREIASGSASLKLPSNGTTLDSDSAFASAACCLSIVATILKSEMVDVGVTSLKAILSQHDYYCTGNNKAGCKTQDNPSNRLVCALGRSQISRQDGLEELANPSNRHNSQCHNDKV